MHDKQLVLESQVLQEGSQKSQVLVDYSLKLPSIQDTGSWHSESTNNINALAITTVNLAVDTFSISTLDATTLTSNTINANNVISPDISVSNLKMSIITTLPDDNTIPDGTMVLYFNAGNYSLQVAAGTPPARYWRSVFLGNP